MPMRGKCRFISANAKPEKPHHLQTPVRMINFIYRSSINIQLVEGIDQTSGLHTEFTFHAVFGASAKMKDAAFLMDFVLKNMKIY